MFLPKEINKIPLSSNDDKRMRSIDLIINDKTIQKCLTLIILQRKT